MFDINLDSPQVNYDDTISPQFGQDISFNDWDIPAPPAGRLGTPRWGDSFSVPMPQSSMPDKPFPEYAIINPADIHNMMKSLATSFDVGMGVAKSVIPGLGGIGDAFGQVGRNIEQSAAGKPLDMFRGAVTGLAEDLLGAVTRRGSQVLDQWGKTLTDDPLESIANILSLPQRAVLTGVLGETGSKLARGQFDFSTAPRDVLDSLEIASIIPAFKAAGMLVKGTTGGAGLFAKGFTQPLKGFEFASRAEKAGMVAGRITLGIEGVGLAAEYALPKIDDKAPWVRQILDNRVVAENSPWRFPFEAATSLPLDLVGLYKFGAESRVAHWAGTKVGGPNQLPTQIIMGNDILNNAVQGGILTSKELNLLDDYAFRQTAEDAIVRSWNASHATGEAIESIKNLPLSQEQAADLIRKTVDRLEQMYGRREFSEMAADTILSEFDGWDNLTHAEQLQQFKDYAELAVQIESQFPHTSVTVARDIIHSRLQAPRAFDYLRDQLAKGVWTPATKNSMMNRYPALKDLLTNMGDDPIRLEKELIGIIGGNPESLPSLRALLRESDDRLAKAMTEFDAQASKPPMKATPPATTKESLGFKQDNPHARAVAAGNPERIAETREWLAGAKNSVTGEYRRLFMDPNELSKLPGARGEEKRFGKPGFNLEAEQKVADISASMKKSGWVGNDAIFIVIEKDGVAQISEGNHRVRAAIDAGMKEVPVQVKYFGGSETMPGVWDPVNIRGTRNARPDAIADTGAKQADAVNKMGDEVLGRQSTKMMAEIRVNEDLQRKIAMAERPSLGTMESMLDTLNKRIVAGETALAGERTTLLNKMKAVREEMAEDINKQILTLQDSMIARESELAAEKGLVKDYAVVDAEWETMSQELSMLNRKYYDTRMAGSRWEVSIESRTPLMRLVDDTGKTWERGDRTMPGKVFDKLFAGIPNKKIVFEAQKYIRNELAGAGNDAKKIQEWLNELHDYVDLHSHETASGFRISRYGSIYHLDPGTINNFAKKVGITAPEGKTVGEVVYRSYPGPLKVFQNQVFGKAIDIPYSSKFHNLSRSLYPQLRFYFSPRFLAMNLYESKVIGGGLGGPKFAMAKEDKNLVAMAQRLTEKESWDAYDKAGINMAKNIAKLAQAKRPDETVKAVLDTVWSQPEMADIARQMGTKDKWYNYLSDVMDDREAVINYKAAQSKAEKEIAEKIEGIRADLKGGIGDELIKRSELERLSDEFTTAVVDRKAAEVAESKFLASTAEYQPFLDAIKLNEEKLIEAMRHTFVGNPSRSAMERVGNSFLLYWPMSYQIKAAKILVQFLSSRAFGFQTGSLGTAVYSRLRQEHERKMEYDPEYANYFEKNKNLLFLMRQMLPITPEDVGVSLSPFLRVPYHVVRGDMGTAEGAKRLITIGPMYDATLVERILGEQSREGGIFNDLFGGSND